MNNIEWNRAKWDVADSWQHEFLNGYAWGGADHVDRWLSQHVLPWLPAGRRIAALEIACGMGRFTDRLLPHVATLHAIDLARVCVDGCRQRFADRPNFSASLTDGKTLPTGPFDVIASFDSLVHADRDVLWAYFSQAPSRLTPGGVMVVHHANHFDLLASRMDVSHTDVQQMVLAAGGLQLLAQTLTRWTAPTASPAAELREPEAPTFIDCVTVVRKAA